MPKKFTQPPGTTPYEEMKLKYPHWDWGTCPICDRPSNYRESTKGLHQECYDSPTGQRYLSRERNKFKNSQSASLFDELDPS